MIEHYQNIILKELKKTLSRISTKQIKNLISQILDSNKIFVLGAGRSGLMMKAFAMRLMHLGFNSYVVGETITPSIGKGDILLIGSGSGETESIIAIAKKAKKIDCNIGVITIYPESTLGQLANLVIEIPASSSKIKKILNSIQPMGSLFEQSLLIFLDYIILNLINKKEIKYNQISNIHANLE